MIVMGLIGSWGAGCARKVPVVPATAVATTNPAAPVIDAARTVVPSGTTWTEAGGLCLPIPEDWRGTTGPPPQILSLVHEGTSVHFDLSVWTADQGIPTDRIGWQKIFEDTDGYRTVPLLSPASTSTWEADGPQGATLQTWSTWSTHRWIEITVTYPFGATIVGRDAIEPLLQGLCTLVPPVDLPLGDEPVPDPVESPPPAAGNAPPEPG